MSSTYINELKLTQKYEESLSRNNNSAKYVLGLSILMIKPTSKIIRFEEIAEKVVGIYFRNVFKYNLVEHNINQPTKVQQDMKEYFDKYGCPERLTAVDKQKLVELVVKNKNNGFFKYVLPCFTGAKKNEKGQYVYPSVGENEFFSYNMFKEELILSDDFLDIINKKYYMLKCITIEKYIIYMEKRNPDNKEISEIINYYLEE